MLRSHSMSIRVEEDTKATGGSQKGHCELTQKEEEEEEELIEGKDEKEEDEDDEKEEERSGEGIDNVGTISSI